MKDKIAFIYGEDVHPRSPMTGCERMSQLFENSIYMSDSKCNYEKLRDEGYRIFCYGHKPPLYRNRKLTKRCLNDIVNTRETWIKSAIGIKCISGFSYWKRHKDLYDCFFPTVTTYINLSEKIEPCLGYYSRDIRPDTTKEFIKYANTVPEEIPIYIMGTPLNLQRKYTFTYDENEFFSHVTHYFYMRSLYHDDPWPHTLLQACQCKCSIIIPDINRAWKDGVDDVLSICDVNVINPEKYNYFWEIDNPCTYAPKGEDFVQLCNEIGETWHWIPNDFKSFRDLYEYAIKI